MKLMVCSSTHDMLAISYAAWADQKVKQVKR